MNILYLVNHLNVGGISSYVLTLASGLKRKGHNIYLASGGGELLPRFKEEGMIYLPIPIKTKQEISPQIFISLLKLIPCVKKYKIEIVHSQSRTTQVLGWLLSSFTRARHIWTAHGFFKRRLLRRTFPCYGRKIIAISESVREHLVKDFGVKDKQIRLVHSGVDTERIKYQKTKSKREIKNTLGLKDGPVIGIVARLSEEKGHTYLLQAMPEVINKFPEAELLIAGKGRMEEKILNLVKALGLEKNVFFFPAIDAQEVYWAMDIFVLPSLKEGLGLALMEAMAYGLAVIGSDVGGIRTLIQDRENGLLVRPADSGELSRAICELLQDAAKRESLGKNAESFINKNFSQEKMVQETEEVYRACLESK